MRPSHARGAGGSRLNSPVGVSAPDLLLQVLPRARRQVLPGNSSQPMKLRPGHPLARISERPAVTPILYRTPSNRNEIKTVQIEPSCIAGSAFVEQGDACQAGCGWLPGGSGEVGGDDVGGVAVQVCPGAVVSHGGAGVSVGRRFLDVAERDSGVEGCGDERVRAGYAARPACPARLSWRCGGRSARRRAGPVWSRPG